MFGSSFTMYPTLSVRHDVKGYSADFQFLEDRLAIGLSTRFNLNKRHNFEFGYVYYADSAAMTPFVIETTTLCVALPSSDSVR